MICIATIPVTKCCRVDADIGGCATVSTDGSGVIIQCRHDHFVTFANKSSSFSLRNVKPSETQLSSTAKSRLTMIAALSISSAGTVAVNRLKLSTLEMTSVIV